MINQEDKAEFQKYPLTMVHPAFQKAQSLVVPGTEVRDSFGNVTRADYQGTPEKFPPVTAANEMEEAYLASQGYEPAGKVDPAAWATAHASAPPPDYKPQPYPRWVDGRIVNSIDEDPSVDPEARAAIKASEALRTSPPDDLITQMEAMRMEMDAMRAELLSAREAPPKNKGGRPRKAPLT
jgi:hypothetical protein